MLDLIPTLNRTCEGVSRRHFLRIGTLGGIGLSLPTLLAAKRLGAGESRPVNCILVWTQGGTSHHDTFDPKPDASTNVRGEYSAIDTAVPGVKFSEIMPRFAKTLNLYGLLRGLNPRNGSHGTADQYMMSGRNFNPAVTHPCYGSIVSHVYGFAGSLPPFVQLGGSVDRRFGGGTSGYLGAEHSAFEMLSDPNADGFAVRDITPPKGVDFARLDRRRAMLARVDALQRKVDLQPAAFSALDEHYKAAINMITAPATKKAFEIEGEDPRLREYYGRTKFGQSCLLARRLIESGVRFVTVTDGGWDHHQNAFSGLRRAMPPVDAGLPALIGDLKERGLLDTTMVVWLTDFGRTPQINSASGRDHWASAGFALLAGAGIPGGSVVGRTDAEGGRPTHNEYFTEDIAATIYTKLGIPLDLITTTPDGRPVRLCDGQVIKEWM